jgi:flagellar hook-length control protein FliK
MLAIHNPTHIETAPPEGKAAFRNEKAAPEGENLLGEVTQEKGQKNDGLGPFAKLLAGLVSKKTQQQQEPAVSSETQISMEAAVSKTKKTDFKPAFFQLKEGMEEGESKNLKNPLLLIKNKTARDQNQVEFDPENPGFIHLSQDQAAETFHNNRPFTAELVSFTREQSGTREQTGQLRDVPERKIPFKRGEAPENPQLAENRNAMLHSGKREIPQETARTETKRQARKQNAFSLEVHDLRTHTGTGTAAENGRGIEEARNSTTKEINLDLSAGVRSNTARGEKTAEPWQRPSPAGENFEQLLAKELRGSLSADIVRQAAVVLRDGGEGTIKLSLKPEFLGKVKIHLEMAENRISGHIVVESEEALRAFEREIRSLEQSFRDSGFEASLNAALDYRNDGQRWKEAPVEPFFSERLAASYEESGTEFISGDGFVYGISAVTMLV